MEILDGKKLSQQIKEEIKQAVDLRKEKGQKIPHLAAVLVGNDGASLTYVGSKVRSCEQVGFKSTLIRLESSISEEALLSKITLIGIMQSDNPVSLRQFWRFSILGIYQIFRPKFLSNLFVRTLMSRKEFDYAEVYKGRLETYLKFDIS